MAAINNSLNLNDRMTPVLRSIMKALDSTLVAMASVDKVSQKAFQQATRDAQNASKAIDGFRASLVNSSSSVRGVETSMDGLIGKAKQLLATYVGFQGLSNLVSSGDTFIGNVARLDLMNDGLQTTAQLQQQIYEASQRSLGNYNEMTAAVAKLGITANHAFGSSKEIVAFTELLNKQFSIAGASQSEKAGAMYQLTQAMASGRLQGDEFRSILENAPMLAKTIADSMGMNYKQMKEASTKGLITSDIIKKALFSVADETNKKFAEMPMKFGDLWMQTINKVVKGLEPLHIKFRDLWNSREFQGFIDGMTNGFVKLMQYAIPVFTAIAGMIAWVGDTWDLLAPIIGGVTAALLVHYGVIAWGSAMKAKAFMLEKAQLIGSTLATMGYTLATFASTWATKGFTVAAKGLGVALKALPLTWILYAVVALIAIFYFVIAVINEVMGTTHSATGIIVGAITGAVAIIWNVLLALGEFIFGVITGAWNLIAMFANFFANVFHNPVAAGIAAFQALGMAVLNIIGGIAKALDTVFGSNLYENVEGWKTGLKQTTNEFLNKAAQEGKYNEVMPLVDKTLSELGGFGDLGRMGVKDAFNFGYEKGDNFQQGIKDNFKIGNKVFNMDDQFFKDMQADLAKTAVNTGKLAEGVNLADEDVELLKENARVNFVNKFTTMTPNVNASFGDVRETADVKGIIETLKQSVLDALESSLT